MFSAEKIDDESSIMKVICKHVVKCSLKNAKYADEQYVINISAIPV